METKLFTPNAQPKDLRDMVRRSNRQPEDYPTYRMIPSDEVMVQIMTGIAKINGAIKFPECPIRKQTFYQLKTRMIQYMLTLIKAGQAPKSWSYKFNGCQVAPGTGGKQTLAAIELFIGPHKFQFHTAIDNPLLCIIYEHLYECPIDEFFADPHQPLTMEETITVWQSLIELFEDSNWFIYEQQLVHGWVNVMRNWYPHLEIKMAKGTNAKLATMLNGGPMMSLKGSDWCKFNELRDNFTAKLAEAGHKYDFKLNLKSLEKN